VNRMHLVKWLKISKSFQVQCLIICVFVVLVHVKDVFILFKRSLGYELLSLGHCFLYYTY